MFEIEEKYIILLISALTLFFLIHSAVCYADDPVMPEILVTSQRSGRFLISKGCEKLILTREDFESLHADSFQELSQVISSVDIIERGAPGSQADMSVRGSSFEGVLVLINGISVRDPQTGHFTLDLPVNFDSIERIEILSGGGSTLYGSSASGGVINIVTRNDSGGVDAGVSAGSYGSADASAGFGFNLGGSDMSGHVRCGKSDGFTRGTDLVFSCADVSGSYLSDEIKVGWNMGILDKRFGAEGFYAPYPSFEKTRTYQGGINALRIIDSGSMLRFRLGARGHSDDFILERGNPELYRNTHYNRSFLFSGEYAAALSDAYSAVTGFEFTRTGISSGNLGNHSDKNNAVYGEFAGSLSNCQFSASLRYDSGFMDEKSVTYGAGAEFPFGSHGLFRLRTEKSFRSPTYTELYYDSPANSGNPDLKSEYSQSIEAGFDHSRENITSGVTLFARRSTDVIDWIRNEGESSWKAENHGAIQTSGIELKAAVKITGEWESRITATLLDQSVERVKGVESKYALNPARAAVSGNVNGSFPAGINFSVVARYEDMLHGDDRLPVSISCSRAFNEIRAVLSVRNVFNERYDEIPGLRAPGRWFSLRLEYSR